MLEQGLAFISHRFSIPPGIRVCLVPSWRLILSWELGWLLSLWGGVGVAKNHLKKTTARQSET